MDELESLERSLIKLRDRSGAGARLNAMGADVLRQQLRFVGWHFPAAGSVDADVVASRIHWARRLEHARPAGPSLL